MGWAHPDKSISQRTEGDTEIILFVTLCVLLDRLPRALKLYSDGVSVSRRRVVLFVQCIYDECKISPIPSKEKIYIFRMDHPTYQSEGIDPVSSIVIKYLPRVR